MHMDRPFNAFSMGELYGSNSSTYIKYIILCLGAARSVVSMLMQHNAKKIGLLHVKMKTEQVFKETIYIIIL